MHCYFYFCSALWNGSNQNPHWKSFVWTIEPFWMTFAPTSNALCLPSAVVVMRIGPVLNIQRLVALSSTLTRKAIARTKLQLSKWRSVLLKSRLQSWFNPAASPWLKERITSVLQMPTPATLDRRSMGSMLRTRTNTVVTYLKLLNVVLRNFDLVELKSRYEKNVKLHQEVGKIWKNNYAFISTYFYVKCQLMRCL